MTMDEAKSFIKGEGTIEESGNFVSKDTTEPSTESTAETQKCDEPVADTKEPTTDEPTKEPAKSAKKYSPEEKSKHAFRQQKLKYRGQLEAKDKELAELRKKLAEYEGKKASDFKDDTGNVDVDKYMDYREELSKARQDIDTRARDNELQRRQYAQAVLEEKISNNFDTDEERGAYKDIVEKANNEYSKIHPEYGTDNFADLLLQEPDHTVAQYLADSEHGPLLLRHFIFKPEMMFRIMEQSGAMNKMFALRDLETRLVGYFQRQKASKQRNLPNTGKTVVSPKVDTSANMWDRKWSAKDASNYLHRHK